MSQCISIEHNITDEFLMVMWGLRGSTYPDLLRNDVNLIGVYVQRNIIIKTKQHDINERTTVLNSNSLSRYSAPRVPILFLLRSSVVIVYIQLFNEEDV